MIGMVWRRVEQITCKYHGEGGLLIITAGSADAVWRTYWERLGEWERHHTIEKLPTFDFSFSCSDEKVERLEIFQDAGCC